MKVALTLMPDSRSCIPAAVRAQLFALDVCQPSPSRKGVPPLGLATLTGFLREHGVDVTAYDYRSDVTGSGSDQIRHLSEDKRYVCEAVTLELLVPIMDRFFAGCDVSTLLRVDREAEYYKRFARERGMFLSGLMASIDELHELVGATLATWSNYDLIGFGTYQSNMYATMLACMALRLSNPKQTIIAGGPEVTQSANSAKLMLYAGLVDAIVPGEALSSTLALIEARKRSAPLSSVPEIWTLDQGVLVQTPSSETFAIDDVPFPDFSDFHPHEYFPFTYPIGTSRGCPFRCNFCSEKDMFGGRFRRMSIDVAYGTVQRAIGSLRCQKIFFGDSLVNTSEKWLETLAERMVSDGLGISWEAYFRAATNRQMLGMLKKSGLTRAVIGLESISDELLAVMIKRQTAASNIGSIYAFIDEGIPTSLSLIVGYPGETSREHDDLIALMEKLTEHNLDVEKKAKADYSSLGFKSLPAQAYPEVCCFPLPFYLKPMSEIFDAPADFSLSVAPYGDEFARYRALPPRVAGLLSSMPYTFESTQIPTGEVFRRLNRVESVPHLKGSLTSFGQRVHTMFHGLRDADRVSMSFRGAFKVEERAYRSSGLEMDVPCELSPATIASLERGCTVGELTTGNSELRHLVAMASVENNLDVTLAGANAPRSEAKRKKPALSILHEVR